MASEEKAKRRMSCNVDGYNMTTAVIPGGCTKYLRTPPGVSWNEPFKAHLHSMYDAWMAGDEDKEYTSGGNLKAPSFKLTLQWIKEAWSSISSDTIVKSFKVCSQTSGKPTVFIHISYF